MNNFKKLICLVMAMALMLTFVSCSNYGKIEKALTNEGYAVSEDSFFAAMFQAIIAESEKYYTEKGEEVPFGVYVYTKGKGLQVEVGVVLEFKDTKKLKEFYDEQSDTFNGVVSDISESQIINGNCILLSSSADMYKVFKEA